MKFENLLKNFKDEQPVKVQIDTPIKYATSKIGIITEFRFTNDGKPKGVCVRFGGMKWSTWFWYNSGTDKRSHYMTELKLIE